MSTPALLPLPRVAELLSVSVPTVRRLVNRGEIAATKVGGQIRVPSSEVARILREAQARMVEVRERQAERRLAEVHERHDPPRSA